MDSEPLETTAGSGVPLVRQFSVFMENRVGSLLRLTKAFESTDLHILALSVLDSVDCSIIRMIVDHPDEAYLVLDQARFPICESELAVVSLPEGKRALLDVLTALMAGEVNVHYTYPLLVQPLGRPALAIAADNVDTAVRVLTEKNLRVLDHSDLMRQF
ncbi:MAG: acetolactate synthase [Planctomycetota bacterium]